MIINVIEETLKYYNENFLKFNGDTVTVPFSKWQDEFTKYLPSGAYILDFGCGSGRDSKAFIDKGYRVDVIDGSKEMCKLASSLINQEVKCVKFQEIDTIDLYDGIWACASILHLPYIELKQVMSKLNMALKKSGYIYMSFKYGEFEGMRNGRYFIDMTEEKFGYLINEVNGYEFISGSITGDVRAGREDEKWYNVIIKKCELSVDIRSEEVNHAGDN